MGDFIEYKATLSGFIISYNKAGAAACPQTD